MNNLGAYRIPPKLANRKRDPYGFRFLFFRDVPDGVKDTSK